MDSVLPPQRAMCQHGVPLEVPAAGHASLGMHDAAVGGCRCDSQSFGCRACHSCVYLRLLSQHSVVNGWASLCATNRSRIMGACVACYAKLCHESRPFLLTGAPCLSLLARAMHQNGATGGRRSVTDCVGAAFEAVLRSKHVGPPVDLAGECCARC